MPAGVRLANYPNELARGKTGAWKRGLMSTLVIASQKNWIEGSALEQLKKTAQLPGMRKAIGMPDLHPGKDAPIGAVFAGDLVYPHLVGNDIGCGMALWQTELRNAKIKLDKWVRRLTGLE